jgi:predicted metal-dependent RNase
MNFKTYIFTEAKKWEDMTPQERKASEEAKKEAEKMVDQGRTDLGLSFKPKKVEEGKEVKKVGPFVTSRQWREVTDPAEKRKMRAKNPPIKRKNVPSVRDIKTQKAEEREKSFQAAGRMAARSKYAN